MIRNITRLLVLLALLFPNGVWAQVATWNFFGQSSPTTLAASTADLNATVSSLTRGAGAASSTGSNSFRTTGFSNNGINVANTDYFQVTVKAKTGYSLSLSGIDAKFAGTSSFFTTPGVTSQYAYSLDGTTFTLIGSPVISTSVTPATVNLSGIAALQNVPATTTVTLRYFASGQTTTGGWGFASPSAASADNGLIIGGTVASLSTPTALAISAPTPASPTVGAPFSVTVQSVDGSNNAANVAANTTVNLSLSNGTGALGGTLTGTILAGSNAITINNITYNTAETGVAITATDGAAVLSSITGGAFTVNAAATQLAFASVPATGTTNTNIGSFTVEARRADNTVDPSFTGNVTVTKNAGPGTLSGTLTAAAVNGIATFNAVQFSLAGSYALDAASGSLTSATSSNINISAASAASDYFRSKATGDWNVPGTWETSSDGISYVTSTIAPTAAANTISIESGHKITIASTSVTADQLIIRTGGTLEFSPLGAQTFTLADGTGIDLQIENGGTLSYTVSGSIITFGASTATVDVATGGKIAISASPQNIQASNYVYNNGSILEYTGTGNFAASGATYFPNANAATVPVFKTTNNISGTIGGGSPLIINGVLEANGSLTFGLSSTKTIRNGIRGTGTVTVLANSPILINGTTAVLGGGNLVLNAALTIASTTVATLISNKVVNGSTFTVNGTLNTNGFILSGTTTYTTAATSTIIVTSADGISASGNTGNIQTTGRVYDVNATYSYTGAAAQITGSGLPANAANLIINNASGVSLSASNTITGTLTLTDGILTTLAGSNVLSLGSTATIFGGSATAYVNGPLVRSTAATTPFAFPVGKAGKYAPVMITPNAATASNYTVEYNTGLYSTPNYSSVNAPLAKVDVSSYYNIDRAAGGADADITLPYSAAANNVTNYTTLVVAHNNGTSWDALTSTPNGDNTSGTVTASAVSNFSPFTLGATSIQPLPFKLAGFNLQKESNKVMLNWTLQTTDGNETATLEHSIDGKSFTAMNTQKVEKAMTVKQSYTDATPAQGNNYYRLALTGANGAVTYSNTLTAVFSKTETVNIYPNPAQQAVKLDWATSNAPVTIELRNITGILINSQVINGLTHFELPVDHLANGAYIITWKQGELTKHQQVQIMH